MALSGLSIVPFHLQRSQLAVAVLPRKWSIQSPAVVSGERGSCGLTTWIGSWKRWAFVLSIEQNRDYHPFKLIHLNPRSFFLVFLV